VLVKAKDRNGKEATATFKVIIIKEDRNADIKGNKSFTQETKNIHDDLGIDKVDNNSALTGKSGFSEQLSVASKLTRLAESRKLLDSLSRL